MVLSMRKPNRQSNNHPIVTKGESVYRAIRDHLNSEGPLVSTTSWMTQFERSELWSSYVEELMTLNLTGRLIASGRYLKGKYSNSTVFRTEYCDVLSEHVPVNREERNRLFRLANDAVDASLENITDGTRNALTTWAKTRANANFG